MDTIERAYASLPPIPPVTVLPLGPPSSLPQLPTAAAPLLLLPAAPAPALTDSTLTQAGEVPLKVEEPENPGYVPTPLLPNNPAMANISPLLTSIPVPTTTTTTSPTASPTAADDSKTAEPNKVENATEIFKI